MISRLRAESTNRVPTTPAEAEEHASYAAQCCLQVLGESPVRIGKALRELGFEIWDRDFDGDESTSGVMAVNADTQHPLVIGINVVDSYEHQRFTLAHELGHYIFDVYVDSKEEAIFIQYNTSIDNAHDMREYRASKFAANLLMPEVEFRKAVEVLGFLKEPGSKISLLAKMFSVSMTAARRRIIELGL